MLPDDWTESYLEVWLPRSAKLSITVTAPDGSTLRSDCSYVAPLVRLALKPGITYSYDVYLATGTVPSMRDTFYRIKRTGA